MDLRVQHSIMRVLDDKTHLEMTVNLSRYSPLQFSMHLLARTELEVSKDARKERNVPSFDISNKEIESINLQ